MGHTSIGGYMASRALLLLLMVGLVLLLTELRIAAFLSTLNLLPCALTPHGLSNRVGSPETQNKFYPRTVQRVTALSS